MAFDDLVRGPQSFAALDIGEFVIPALRRQPRVLLFERAGRCPLYGDDIEISDAAARVLAGAASGFFDEALEICGRLADLSGLAGEFKTRLGLCGKALFLPLRAALTGRIDGPDLADLITLMPRERVREWFAALIKKP